MKITTFLFFASFISVSATVFSQSKISVDLKNVTVKDVFTEIEQKSDFKFLYRNELVNVNREVTIRANDESIENVLERLFVSSDLTFKVFDNNLVVITSKAVQQKKITGTVTDSQTGEGLPGVNVIIEGSTIGTTTDIDGKYSLDFPQESAVLVFSYVGYISEKIPYAGQAVMDVKMIADITNLEEVIVVGYGTANRKEFTGSVSSLKMENSAVSLAPNLNALESLKGNIAGLNIGATNTAGGEPAMDIRGQNSIGGNNDPLIVLDGVIYLGSLNDINPNDIASYDILKDAVSAAVYGSRSANGVIAITTKKGSSEKPMITFSALSGIQTWQNKPEMMKGEEWIKVVNARNKYAEGTTTWMKAGELANLAANKETVWLDEVTRQGVIQDYQMAVSGATKLTNYYLSTSYNKNKGIVVGDDFDRLSILAKVKTNITKWLEVGVDGGFSQRDYSGFAANIGEAQTMSPYGVMYRDDQGNLEKYPYTQSAINPLWGVDDGTRSNLDKRNNFRLNTYAYIQIPWVKGLSYRLNYLTNLDKNQSGNFYNENYYIKEGEGLARYSAATVAGFLSSANGNVDNNSTYSYVFDNIVNYKNSFGKHKIDVTLVATRDYRKYEQENSTGSDFSANGNTVLGLYGLHKATVQKVIMNIDERANIGYLGRLNYSFNDKYFFTSSYRRDGASVFGANKKWADFYAAGLAWRISGEEFMKNITFLNDLKLKFSWGQNGNQGIGPYGTLSTVANGATGGYRYEFSNSPGIIRYGLLQDALGNPELGWESTESWNTGFESSWFNNRLQADLDVYFSKTTDQIFTRNIPVMTGFKTVKTSMGQIDNSGIELTIRSVNVRTTDWNWSSWVTFWRNRNKLAKLYGEDINGDGKEDDDIASSLFIGKSLGAIYGYEQDGIVQETDTEYITLTGAAPGSPKYKDIDGVPGITSADRKILGYNKENFRLNLSNSVSYKNFELYTMVTGTFGGNNYYLKSNTNAYMTSGTGRFNDNMTSKPYWTPESKSNEYPSAYFAGDGRFLGLQSRGFVRIQDISLAYTFQQNLLKKLRLSTLKVYVSAKNVATFTNWVGGDPETGTTVRENTFPVPSTYSIGANLSF